MCARESAKKDICLKNYSAQPWCLASAHKYNHMGVKILKYFLTSSYCPDTFTYPMLPLLRLLWPLEVPEWHHGGTRICHSAAPPVGLLGGSCTPASSPEYLAVSPPHYQLPCASRLGSITMYFPRVALVWPLVRTATSAKPPPLLIAIIYFLKMCSGAVCVLTHIILATIVQRRWKEVGRPSNKFSARGW